MDNLYWTIKAKYMKINEKETIWIYYIIYPHFKFSSQIHWVCDCSSHEYLHFYCSWYIRIISVHICSSLFLLRLDIFAVFVRQLIYSLDLFDICDSWCMIRLQMYFLSVITRSHKSSGMPARHLPKNRTQLKVTCCGWTGR